MKQLTHFWLTSAIALSGLFTSIPALSQVVPDTTLPNNSSVSTDGDTSTITGGTQAGGNLFHSFEQFSIPTGGTAYFNNAVDVQNIFSRVTGKDVSNIDGLIRANGSANLFLINPNGIIFGPKARLDVGGSFIATTASSLKFADGTNFSATVPQANPLLTVNVPIGLQFGENPSRIVQQSIAVNNNDNLVGLQVQPKKTLALVGGDVVLEGGTLAGAGGRIELGSVAGSSIVNLTTTISSWTLGYENVSNFKDIQLSQAALVDISGEGGGSVQLQGRRIVLTDGSQIAAINEGLEPGGTFSVSASESVELAGASTNTSRSFSTSLFTGTINAGNGSDLTINTKKLLIRDGAFISTNTLFEDETRNLRFGDGQGGRLVVNASESVELMGISADSQIPSGLFTQTQSSGNAGDLTIATRRLLVTDGAQISAAALGAGNGGNLIINAADTVQLSGNSVDGQLPTGLFADTSGTGDAGDLNIATGKLYILNGARTSVSSQGAGNAGNLQVAAGSIQLVNQAALTAQSASGSGGNIVLQVQDLMLLRGNSTISAISGTENNGGNAGYINIDTGFFFASENSDIIANSFAGLGANVQINANGFLLSPDSEVIVNGKEIELSRQLSKPNLDFEFVPQNFVDIEGQIATGCPAEVGPNASKFVYIGRSGLPPTPTEALNSDSVLVDLGKPIQVQENRATAAPATNPTRVVALKTVAVSPQLIEAQGWVMDDNGDIVLTATPTATLYIPWLSNVNCHTAKAQS